jgi:hypothetical protein
MNPKKIAHMNRMKRFAELTLQGLSPEECEPILKQECDVVAAKGHTGTFIVRVAYPRGPAKILEFK